MTSRVRFQECIFEPKITNLSVMFVLWYFFKDILNSSVQKTKELACKVLLQAINSAAFVMPCYQGNVFRSVSAGISRGWATNAIATCVGCSTFVNAKRAALTCTSNKLVTAVQ